MSIEKSLQYWDGKSSESIREIYRQHSKSKSFIDDVAALFDHAEYEFGASWLLKKHLEEGNTIDIRTISIVYRHTTKLSEWGAKLHILQSMPFILIPDIEKETVEEFLRNCLTDKNKFVRAWAYGGFYLLADQFPEYRAEAKQFIEAALIEESASVRARIRNVVKSGFLAKKN